MDIQITNTSEKIKSFIYAGDTNLLYALIILMIIDIVTGIFKAIKNKNLWSRKSMIGFTKKILIFCIIVLANILDQLLNLNGGLLMVTLFYYIANEGLSIVENCAEMGVLVPKQISEKLDVINEKSKNNTDKEE